MLTYKTPTKIQAVTQDHRNLDIVYITHLSVPTYEFIYFR